MIAYASFLFKWSKTLIKINFHFILQQYFYYHEYYYITFAKTLPFRLTSELNMQCCFILIIHVSPMLQIGILFSVNFSCSVPFDPNFIDLHMFLVLIQLDLIGSNVEMTPEHTIPQFQLKLPLPPQEPVKHPCQLYRGVKPKNHDKDICLHVHVPGDRPATPIDSWTNIQEDYLIC